MIRKKKAFTIIEIIIALTILGIGLVAVMGYLPLSLNASAKASNMIKASMVAQRVIEQIKLESYDDITQADSFATGTYSQDTAYPGFDYLVEVDPSGNATVKDIKVTVRWTTKGSFTTEVFETKIPKYNPE